jgi:hypothetical protein
MAQKIYRLSISGKNSKFNICAIELKIGRKLKTPYSIKLSDRKLQVLGLFLFSLYYASRLYFLSSTGELYLAFINSPLGQIVELK